MVDAVTLSRIQFGGTIMFHYREHGRRSRSRLNQMYSRARAPSVECEAVGYRDEWTPQVSEDFDG